MEGGLHQNRDMTGQNMSARTRYDWAKHETPFPQASSPAEVATNFTKANKGLGFANMGRKKSRGRNRFLWEKRTMHHTLGATRAIPRQDDARQKKEKGD